MKKIVLCFSLFFPLISFASTDIASMINSLQGVFTAALSIATSAAVVYFVWQVIQYTIADGSGKNTSGIVWGLIGLTVIVSVWGFVGAIQSTLGV